MWVFFQVSSVYKCTHPGCAATFITRSGYLMHIKRHSGVYFYNCPYCQKGMSSTNVVKKHLKAAHTGKLGYHCNRCQEEFLNVHILKSHLQQNVCFPKKC